MEMKDETITRLVLRKVDLYSPHLREEDSFNFGIPVMKVWYDEQDEFPKRVEGTFYIVSRLVAENNMFRDDFLMVHRTVRDSDGRIIGCTAFATTAFDPTPARFTDGIGEEE